VYRSSILAPSPGIVNPEALQRLPLRGGTKREAARVALVTMTREGTTSAGVYRAFYLQIDS